MSGLKAIRRRISSVKNTRQITRAMKLVSAAKLRRAQQGAENGRDFGRGLSRVVQQLIKELPDDFHHPLLEKPKEVKRRRVIVIAGERGLCGAYNANVFKAVIADQKHSPIPVEITPVGRRAVSFFRKLGWELSGTHEGLSEDAAQWPIEEIAHELVRDFTEGKIQEVKLYYTQFVSALTQRVQCEELLPFSSLTEESSSEESETGAVKFDPSPAEILSQIMPMLVAVRIRQAGLEAKASEHAARMTAMESATSNAGDLIDRLQLTYNRARQSAITRELIDIIGGSEAAQ